MSKRLIDAFPAHLSPRPIQKSTLEKLDKIWDTSDIIVVNLPVACHSPSQEVIMANGEVKKIKDIKIGDQLIGTNSEIRTVTKLHSGTAQMYKIKPRRGKEWIVTGNHILYVKRYIRPMVEGKRVGQFAYEEITVEEYISKSADYKNNTWLVKDRVDNFVGELPEHCLPIPSYLLGVWLGDGHSDGPTITSMDKEIYSEWIGWGLTQCRYVRTESNGSKAFTFNLTNGRGQPNKVLNMLKTLNIINNKHIPKKYLTAERNSRLQLLAGLIDTDGHTDSEKSSIEITQKNKQLSDDILFLARSLGYSANQHIKIIDGVNYYRCHISGINISELPVKLVYKKPTDSKSDQRNCKFDVISVEVGEFNGVSVDGNNLYLLDDFTVSHNSGKSAISLALSKWKKSAAILAPSKLLVDQYQHDYPFLATLRGKSSYYCENFDCTLDNRPVFKKAKLCKYHLGCEGCNSYLQDQRRARVSKTILCNYHVYLYNRLYRDTIIVDEAHQLIPVIKELGTKKIWAFKHKIPTDKLINREKIKEWINSLKDEAFQYHFNLDYSRKWAEQKQLLLLKQELNSKRPTYLVRVATDTYHGEEMPVIKMEPLDISNTPERGMFFPDKVKKIILMSATISRKDIEQLGLAGKKVSYISADSPISKNRRPVIFPKYHKSMAWRVQNDNLPELASFINLVAELSPDDKGLIHCTYSLSTKLRQSINKLYPELNRRLIWHNKDNKTERYNMFRDAAEPKILVASGMYEGIDLPYDAGRWQIIAKIPWPSLADPAIAYMTNLDKEYYPWETIKTVLQACGRICRTPEDYGETICFDSTFEYLYNNNLDMFPKWFRTSILDETGRLRGES